MKSPAHVLVVEDNPVTRKLVRLTLEAEGIHVVEAPDATSAIAAMTARTPDLVLQDIVLPDMNGFELVQRLRATARGDSVPIVAMTGLLSRAEEAKLGQRSFDEMLVKPVEPSRLVQVVRKYLPASPAPERGSSWRPVHHRHVLLVDDDPVQLKLSRLHLVGRGFDVTTATNGTEALALARQRRPDGILSDVMMPHTDGFALCRLVRQDPTLASVPLVLMSAYYVEAEDAELATDAGATALVPRSEGVEQAVEALVRGIHLGTAPAPSVDATALTDAHIGRLMRQLEVQAAFNAGLQQRSVLQGGALAAMRRLSDVLGRDTDLPHALEEVVYILLDLSSGGAGAVFLENARGALELGASAGFEAAAAASFFGRAELFAELLADLQALDLTASDGGRALLAAAGVPAGALVPLVVRGRRVGALLLTFKAPDALNPDRLELARTMAVQIAQAVALHQAFCRVERANRKYRTLLEAASDSITLLTPEGVILDVNRRCEEILQFPRAAMVGHHIREFAPPGREESNVQNYHREGGGRLAVPIQRADGTVAHVEYSHSPVEVDGETIVFAIGRDITDTVAGAESLRASEEKYRSLVERIPDMAWRVRLPDWHIVFLSRAVERLTGFAAEEVAHGMWLDRVHADDRTRVDEACAALGRDRKPLDMVYRFQHKDGRWIWLHDRATVAYESDGAEFADGLLSDVTGQRNLEEQLRQFQKIEALGQLTGGVAHDFNNILAVILANAHFLTESFGPADERRADAEEIRKAAERGAGLTRQLLAFSRRQVLEPTNVDLNEVVRDLEKMLHRLLGEDIDVTSGLADGLGIVHADRGQLEQVVLNMAVNARDAMPNGGKLSITTANVDLAADTRCGAEVVPAGRYVAVTLEDTGCGMTAEVCARMFEPFFTTKERGRGTGLGLATCFGIVKQSGGAICVHTDVGRGSRFTVFLPRVEATADAPSTPTASPASGPGGETVLLVEDDDLVRSALRRALSSRGFRVLTAADGAEADAVASIHGPAIDVIVTDVVIPGSNGPEVVAALSRRCPRAKALFVSGYSDHAVLRSARIDTSRNFLQKPFPPAALANRIRQLLDIQD
jgi:PAS domain S-box-containing protein